MFPNRKYTFSCLHFTRKVVSLIHMLILRVPCTVISPARLHTTSCNQLLALLHHLMPYIVVLTLTSDVITLRQSLNYPFYYHQSTRTARYPPSRISLTSQRVVTKFIESIFSSRSLFVYYTVFSNTCSYTNLSRHNYLPLSIPQ